MEYSASNSEHNQNSLLSDYDNTMVQPSDTQGLNVTAVIYLMMVAAYSAAATKANQAAMNLDPNLLYIESATIVGAGGKDEMSAEMQAQDAMQAQLTRAGVPEPEETP